LIYTDFELKKKIHEMLKDFETEVVEFKEATTVIHSKISANISPPLEMRQISEESPKVGLYLVLPIKGSLREQIIVRVVIFSL